MKKPWIQCPQCKGHGEIPLPTILEDVLKIIRKHQPVTVDKIYKELNQPGIGITAINNRVRALERNGFVKRDGKKGKNWIWRAV